MFTYLCRLVITAALLNAQSPKPQVIEESEIIDAACLVATMSMKSVPDPRPDANKDDVEEMRNTSFALSQFYMGRLTALHPHRNWFEFATGLENRSNAEENSKMILSCISRAARLTSGDD